MRPLYAAYALDTGAQNGNKVSINSPGNGKVVTWNGSAWIPKTPTGDYWSLKGNTGTAPGTNFVGTTDDVTLEFQVNGERALRL